MESLTSLKRCKYCNEHLEICVDEGLQCIKCSSAVHIRCLRRGSAPGGINGDVFFEFICLECSETGIEKFHRTKLSWLQVINLALYHLQTRSSGLARNGFFHWRNHIVSFIDRNWETFFPGDIRRKKRWLGTVAGRLSYYNSYLFLSGAKTVFNKPAWWTTMYPKLSPYVISELYSQMSLEKQRNKMKNEKKIVSDAELFQYIVQKHIKNEELTQTFNIEKVNLQQNEMELDQTQKKSKNMKKKMLLPSYSEASSRKLLKLASHVSFLPDESLVSDDTVETKINKSREQSKSRQPLRLLDPLCHYNTSLNNISQMKMQKLQIKLTGGIRKEIILSPYSAIYLKPYIRRDTQIFPSWLKLMAEVQLAANKNNPAFELLPRAPIDFTYVQPEHIPAINSLCNQFFWSGIDLTESLQYPDFSCVVLYKRLVVGFAFLVPDVNHTENYISFVFTRPGWRNCGIGKFMIYHLIQTSLGKDITLHVSINNPAFFLYQKFGFKVENVVLDFYNKYYRNDICESKHAFLCRLER
ncbi:cysteine-rich protein 2-binding protein [Cylas formicarius]|uniref:cysteine-rich protein 2-binding protein n=1 Tax=Cylas formicarius TaxID=197179 RepID=UPI0029585C76|nr:cysteine-rich protein 2-binding protein [Cylas formicarius]